MITFTVPGDPRGKERTGRNKAGYRYTPPKTVNYESLVGWGFKEKGGRLMHGAIAVTIDAYMYIPKNTSQKRRRLMNEGKFRPLKKPDMDNITKIILDGLNHIAYDDDKQVVQLILRKWYSDEPRTTITVQEVV